MGEYKSCITTSWIVGTLMLIVGLILLATSLPQGIAAGLSISGSCVAIIGCPLDCLVCLIDYRLVRIQLQRRCSRKRRRASRQEDGGFEPHIIVIGCSRGP